MKKRIIATLSAVLAVILLLFTSAFASSAADDAVSYTHLTLPTKLEV